MAAFKPSLLLQEACIPQTSSSVMGSGSAAQALRAAQVQEMPRIALGCRGCADCWCINRLGTTFGGSRFRPPAGMARLSTAFLGATTCTSHAAATCQLTSYWTVLRCCGRWRVTRRSFWGCGWAATQQTLPQMLTTPSTGSSLPSLSLSREI